MPGERLEVPVERHENLTPRPNGIAVKDAGIKTIQDLETMGDQATCRILIRDPKALNPSRPSSNRRPHCHLMGTFVVPWAGTRSLDFLGVAAQDVGVYHLNICVTPGNSS